MRKRLLSFLAVGLASVGSVLGAARSLSVSETTVLVGESTNLFRANSNLLNRAVGPQTSGNIASSSGSGTNNTLYKATIRAVDFTATNLADFIGGFTSSGAVYSGGVTNTSLSASLPIKTDADKKMVSGAINLASGTEVTGNLPVTRLNSGTSASSATWWRGDGTWAAPPGSGDVNGPASSVDRYLPIFNGVGGKTLQASGALIDSTHGIFSDHLFLTNGALVTGLLTNSALTASTLVSADANKALASVANGTGSLKNNGSGTLTWAAVDLASSDVGGNLGVAHLNSGSSASSSTFWRGDGTWSTPVGAGDVIGPASSVDRYMPIFSGTGGKTLQASGTLIDSTHGLFADHLFLTNGTVVTGLLTNSALTASTVLSANANKALTSIANGAGVLTNGASGTPGFGKIGSTNALSDFPSVYNGLADGHVLTWIASQGKYSNAPPSAGGSGAGVTTNFEYSLPSGVSAAATSITLDRAPSFPSGVTGGDQANVPLLAIGAWTTNCELRRVGAVSGTSVNINGPDGGLVFAHAASEKVLYFVGDASMAWFNPPTGFGDNTYPVQRAIIEANRLRVWLDGNHAQYGLRHGIIGLNHGKLKNFEFRKASGFTWLGNGPEDCFFQPAQGECYHFTGVGATDIITVGADSWFPPAGNPEDPTNSIVVFHAKPGESLPSEIIPGATYFVKEAVRPDRVIIATLTITNVPNTGTNLTINGTTRYWGDVSNSTTILTNLVGVDQSATNLYDQLRAHPISGLSFVEWVSTSAIQLVGSSSLTVSRSTNWASLTFVTNRTDWMKIGRDRTASVLDISDGAGFETVEVRSLGRYYIENVEFNGAGIVGNGVGYDAQQPLKWDTFRIVAFTNMGLWLSGQGGEFHNAQILSCYYPLVATNASLMKFYNFNAEDIPGWIDIGGNGNNFFGGHIESGNSRTNAVFVSTNHPAGNLLMAGVEISQSGAKTKILDFGNADGPVDGVLICVNSTDQPENGILYSDNFRSQIDYGYKTGSGATALRRITLKVMPGDPTSDAYDEEVNGLSVVGMSKRLFSIGRQRVNHAFGFIRAATNDVSSMLDFIAPDTNIWAQFHSSKQLILTNGGALVIKSNAAAGRVPISDANGVLTLGAIPTVSTFASVTATNSITVNGTGVGGTLAVDTTAVGNVGGGEDDLEQYGITAGLLAANKDHIEFDVFGTFAATANAKTLKIYFGSTVILTTTSLVLNNLDWRGHGKVIRTSPTTQKATCELTVGGTLLSAVNSTITDYTAPTENITNDITFKCTGSDDGLMPADNAVVQQGMVLRWFPGVPAYSATAATFDGANDFMHRGAGLTGASDGKVGSLSFWFKSSASSAGIFSGTNYGEHLDVVLSGGGIEVDGYDSGGTLQLRILSTGTSYNDNAWHHCAISWDLTGATGNVYVDGVSDKTWPTGNNVNLDLTAADWLFGGRANESLLYTGCATEFMMWFQYIDWSVASNLEKVYQAGAPVNPGSTGTLVNGSQPIVYFRAWSGVNAGSGGNFTLTGSLDGCIAP